MTFVHNKISVLAYDIFDLPFSAQTLDEGHIDGTRWLSFATANSTDLFGSKIEETRQPSNPLIY